MLSLEFKVMQPAIELKNQHKLQENCGETHNFISTHNID
jgi:hypothetical protein